MYLGIEIGGTKLQIVAGDAHGIVQRWRGNVRRALGGGAICDQIREGIIELRRTAGSAPIKAAGVGFGGPIDVRTGKICRSHQIDGWENFPLRDWLAELLGVPVAVDNDANVGALGEAVRGAGQGADPVFYVTMGSGVGGGLVARGGIYHGLPPGEAEFGHLRLDRDGATVESRCSGWAVDARVRRLVASQPTSLLARLVCQVQAGGASGGEARAWAAAIRQGDADAMALLRDVAGDVAFALSHAVHLFHPQVIVLGGGLSLVGPPLAAAVAEALEGFVMAVFRPVPAVRLAALGEDAVPTGAIELTRGLAPETLQ